MTASHRGASETQTCWVLTPGEAGMRSQALGLAEAVGLPVVEKRVAARAPWSWLPGGLLPAPLAVLDQSGGRLAPPWPALVVACGRKAIDAALAVKRLSGGKTLAAYVQNPEYGRKRFDLVAALPHDRVAGANVAVVGTALHRVTERNLGEAREQWRRRLAGSGAPLLGVLVGGDNASYRLTDAVLARLVHVLKTAHAEHGFGVAVTPSRRTGARAMRILGEALAAEPWAFLWDEEGDNPYLGILALSSRLIVTAESISMVSEALAAGRPVHVLPLEGEGRRHDAFLARMVGEKLVSPIEADDLDWSFAGTGPVNATAEPARRIRAMLAQRGIKPGAEN